MLAVLDGARRAVARVVDQGTDAAEARGSGPCLVCHVQRERKQAAGLALVQLGQHLGVRLFHSTMRRLSRTAWGRVSLRPRAVNC